MGPQIGYLFPVAGMQDYLNFQAYYEFDAKNRPEGWGHLADICGLPGRSRAAVGKASPAQVIRPG